MGVVIEPRVFGGDGVYLGNGVDEVHAGPIFLQYGLWIPLFMCQRREKRRTKKIFEKMISRK